MLAIGLLILVAVAGRRLLPGNVSVRLGRAVFWLCNGLAAALVVVVGATALRGLGQPGIGMLVLPLYLGLGAAVMLLGLVLQHILAPRRVIVRDL